MTNELILSDDGQPHVELPSLGEYWDALRSYAFTPAQGNPNLAVFFKLQEFAELSVKHDELMHQFWDAAFDGTPRPARPRDSYPITSAGKQAYVE